MHDVIRIRGISITFLQTRHQTGGALDLFEVTIPGHQGLFVPHLHTNYDETIFGVDGIATWMVEGEVIRVRPGDQLFIPRGAVHGFLNKHDLPCRMMFLLTPGVVGPEYFCELAYAIQPDGTADLAEIASVMTRYGVRAVAQ